MRPISIEIVSDWVCPWCYIGKRRLERALQQRPGLPVTLHWSPFQLSPDMPPEGRDRAEHYAEIFGPERARMIIETMRETARDEGLEFGDRPGARSPNTLLAHLLMDFAAAQGADATRLAERLFAAHHVDCEDLGDPAVLQEIAADCGLDAEAAAAALASPERRERVGRQVREMAARGINGVPFFVFNGRYAVSGAQPADALLQVIDRLAA
ncbi:MAG: DsbA family oxidoreductase [Gammaproteobacteria bacterium]|nr:MAG: DsbA family oxidoreductase [Gammaproteobacteria bacterium]